MSLAIIENVLLTAPPAFAEEGALHHGPHAGSPGWVGAGHPCCARMADGERSWCTSSSSAVLASPSHSAKLQRHFVISESVVHVQPCVQLYFLCIKAVQLYTQLYLVSVDVK